MRILFLCHRLPYPPNKGDKIRSFHEISHLAKRHQVHLLTFEDPAVGGRPEEVLQKYCSSIEVFPLSPLKAWLRASRGLLGSRPLTTSYFRSPAFERRVRELAVPGSFDVLMASGSGMAPYAGLAPDLPKLLDMVDVDSAKWDQYARFSSLLLRPIWGLESKRLSAFEATLDQQFKKVVLTTAREVAVLESHSPGVRGAVVRNGVDLAAFGRATRSKSPVPTLVFTGQMDYFANVDGVVQFCSEVLPRLKSERPDLQFMIVGRSPTAKVKNLERIPGVTVTGEVGTVEPYLSAAWVFVAPLRIAQGVQNKVLEAMAAGVPAVVSARVMAGLSDGGFQHNRDLMVASDDEGFLDAVRGLITDEPTRRRLSSNARLRLVESYSWEKNMNDLEDLLEEVVDSTPRFMSCPPDLGSPVSQAN